MISNLNLHRDHHIAQWRSSGLSRAAYCRQHGIAYHVFISWTKHSGVITKGATPSAFIEVSRPSYHVPERPSPTVASISFSNGVMMRFVTGTDADWIGRVVAAVRSC
jgi:hypothetical protein